MAAVAGGVDSMAAIRRVNDTLQGPVVDILLQLVPEMKSLPRAEALERTLDDVALLERCFQAFRRERDRFRSVLVDEANRPVADDAAPLKCGRTLNEVIAMVVRTAAKRHFRRRYTPKAPHKHLAPRLHDASKLHAMAHRVASLFERKEAPKAPVRSRADELYEAIQQYLLHEWQVPLVPTYADMSPLLVRELGPKLLEVREKEHLRRIVDDPAEAAKLFDLPPEEVAAAPAAATRQGDKAAFALSSGEAKPQAAKAGAEPAKEAPAKDQRARLSEVLAPDGKTLKAEAFTAVLTRPGVRQVLKDPDQVTRKTGILKGVGAVPAKLLVAELGLRTDQLAVVLLVAHETIGTEVFNRVFGQVGNAEMIMRMTQKARAEGIGQASPLEDCARFVRALFARFSSG